MDTGCISFQVVQEFFNVVTRKFTVPPSEKRVGIYLINVLEPLSEINSSKEIFIYALDIMERWKYSIYDSLIISTAAIANCSILYSEDFKHSEIIMNLHILDLFIK